LREEEEEEIKEGGEGALEGKGEESGRRRREMCVRGGRGVRGGGRGGAGRARAETLSYVS